MFAYSKLLFAWFGLVSDENIRTQNTSQKYYYVERADSDISIDFVHHDLYHQSLLSDQTAKFEMQPKEVEKVNPLLLDSLK